MRMRIWIIGIIVLCACLGVIAEEASEAINHCDLKKKETVLKCVNSNPWQGQTNCRLYNKLLIHFYCPKCDVKDKVLLNSIRPKENESLIISAKCPKCGEKIITEEWLIHGKCSTCYNKKPQQVFFCLKTVYTCPEHKDFEFFKKGKCSKKIIDAKGKEKKCGKKLELNRTVYSPIIYVYECSKCKARSEEKGKCEVCNKKLRKIKTCKDSGTFPHVNKKEWKKQHKNN